MWGTTENWKKAQNHQSKWAQSKMSSNAFHRWAIVNVNYITFLWILVLNMTAFSNQTNLRMNIDGSRTSSAQRNSDQYQMTVCPPDKPTCSRQITSIQRCTLFWFSWMNSEYSTTLSVSCGIIIINSQPRKLWVTMPASGRLEHSRFGYIFLIWYSATNRTIGRTSEFGNANREISQSTHHALRTERLELLRGTIGADFTMETYSDGA